LKKKPMKTRIMKIRINKFLAESGIASRRKSEEFILQGRVAVNHKIIHDLSSTVDSEKDIVFVDGEKVKPKTFVYFLLNKPKGYVTTTYDERKRKKVIDLVKSNTKIFPVGRLDYNTTGVLFLTNDGNFSQILTHPKNKIRREYDVKLDKSLDKTDIDKFLSGIYLDERKGKFLDIKPLNTKDHKSYLIACEEGRNHFIKRMFRKLGYTVINLNRSGFAGIKADIPVGAYRKLSYGEVKKIISNYSQKLN